MGTVERLLSSVELPEMVSVRQKFDDTHIPVEEMGQMTAKILIDRIEGGHRLPVRVNLPFYTAIRDSCAPPKRT